jgi:hypothetical protein
MSAGKPTHKFTEHRIGVWVQYEMPMIWHNAIRQNTHVGKIFRFLKQGFKMLVVFILLKDSGTTICAIDYMIDNIGDGYPSLARHANSMLQKLDKYCPCPHFSSRSNFDWSIEKTRCWRIAFFLRDKEGILDHTFYDLTVPVPISFPHFPPHFYPISTELGFFVVC